jgi:hypothetical protein
MLIVTILDDSTGEVWSGFADGKARPLGIIPVPDGPGSVEIDFDILRPKPKVPAATMSGKLTAADEPVDRGPV